MFEDPPLEHCDDLDAVADTNKVEEPDTVEDPDRAEDPADDVDKDKVEDSYEVVDLDLDELEDPDLARFCNLLPSHI